MGRSTSHRRKHGKKKSSRRRSSTSSSGSSDTSTCHENRTSNNSEKRTTANESLKPDNLLSEQTSRFRELLQKQLSEVKNLKTALDITNEEFVDNQFECKAKMDAIMQSFSEALQTELGAFQKVRRNTEMQMQHYQQALEELAATMNCFVTTAEIHKPPDKNLTAASDSTTNIEPPPEIILNSIPQQQIEDLLKKPPPPPPQSNLSEENTVNNKTAILPYKGTEVLVNVNEIVAQNPVDERKRTQSVRVPMTEAEKPNLKFPHVRPHLKYNSDWTIERKRLENSIKAHRCGCLLNEQVIPPSTWTEADLEAARDAVVTFIQNQLLNEIFRLVLNQTEVYALLQAIGHAIQYKGDVSEFNYRRQLMNLQFNGETDVQLFLDEFSKLVDELRAHCDVSAHEEKRYLLMSIDDYAPEILTAEQGARDKNPEGLSVIEIMNRLKAFYARKLEAHYRAKQIKGEALVTAERALATAERNEKKHKPKFRQKFGHVRSHPYVKPKYKPSTVSKQSSDKHTKEESRPRPAKPAKTGAIVRVPKKN